LNENRLKVKIVGILDKIFDNFYELNLYEYITSPEKYLHQSDFEVDELWGLKEDLDVPENIHEIIDDVASYCVSKFETIIFKNNQFIYLDIVARNKLMNIYQSLFESGFNFLRVSETKLSFAEKLSDALKKHHHQIEVLLKSCVFLDDDDYFLKYISRPTVSEDYSPEFQFELFQIDPDKLRQPILDLGCGNTGRLVNYLWKKGMDVLGVDRVVPEGINFVKADWFYFKLRRTYWGTIIAHQSLSTHFIFYHSLSDEMARRYARLFMNILDALQVNGKFYYAPGLPFFEEYVADLSKIETRKIPVRMNVDVKGIDEIAYAVEMTRLG